MLVSLQNEHLAVTADTRGAELRSIACGGVDYLWSGDPAHWSGRAPILFPFIGALRKDWAACAAGEVALYKHGLARKAEFELEDRDDDIALFRLASDAETRKGYPYDFELRVEYALSGRAVTTTISVRNTGGVPLPWCAGGHPGFRVPLAAGESFDDYRIVFEQPETALCPTVDLITGLIDAEDRNLFMTERDSFRLNHVLFRGDALVFDRLKSRSATLIGDKSGRGVRMDFEGMDYFAVWSPFADSPFVCLEPWTGTATLEQEDDVFEHKRGIRLTPPGGEEAVAFTVTVL